MDEKIFSEWKEDNAELYAKFKVDLEEQLKKPYHQTILDMSEGNIEPLQSVIADISDIISKDGIDIDKLYTKAIETGDTSTYCLCCYLLFDNGEDQLAKAILEKIEESGTQEIINAARVRT